MKKYSIFILLLIPVFITAQTTDQMNTELSNVQQHITDKNYAQGLSILNSLLTQNPNDNNIYRHYAELLLDLKHYDLALSNIQKAILLSKSTPSNHLIAGNIYRAQKNYTEAQNAYNKTIQLDPGMGEAYTEFTLLNLQHYFMRDAQRLAELAYRFTPNSWKNIILRAKIAQQTGQISRAQKIFLEGIQQFPYNEQLLDAFAEFYISNNEMSKAIIILEEANSRFGESVTRNLLLGDSAFFQKQQDEAIKYYEIINNTYQQLKLPLSPMIQWRLYNLYRINNEIEKSYSFLQSALELDPLNQLYISEFYQYLLSTDNQSLKISLSQHLENIANQERKTGIDDYYLSILQKIVRLNPSNNKIRRKLINYAKIQGNEDRIQDLVTQSLAQEPNNQQLKNTAQLRKHLNNTQRLDVEKTKIYQYTNKIFVEDNICYFARSIQQELGNLEIFYPNIISKIELKQKFAQESRTMFQTNTNYNIVTHAFIDRLGSTIHIAIYDKKGLPLATFKHGFQTKNLTTILVAFTRYINKNLPSIGYILQRQADSHFKISLGTNNSLSTNSQVAIMNKDFIPLTIGNVISITAKDAIIKQVETPLEAIDIDSAYIVPLQYVPSLISSNTNTTTQTTSIISNINQITQTRYPLQIKLSLSQE